MTLSVANRSRAVNRASIAKGLPSILIVDDSRDSANILKSVFDDHGYEAYVAYDWATAVETGKDRLPDIILLDIGMPEMDGIHLGRLFREDEQLKDKVLIAVTGYADDRHRQQCADAGFDYLVPKPIAWDELKSIIDRLWSRRQKR